LLRIVDIEAEHPYISFTFASRTMNEASEVTDGYTKKEGRKEAEHQKGNQAQRRKAEGREAQAR
jgi:hypothetical protein